MTCASLSSTGAGTLPAGKGAALSTRSQPRRRAPVPGFRLGLFVTSMSPHTRGTTAAATFVDVGPETVQTESDPKPTRSPSRIPEPKQELPFTLGDIRRAIPKHCFERSIWRSFSYLIRDLVAIAALVYASTFIDPLPVATAVKYGILWPMYWFWVGAFGVGLWIVSHECGHGAFSEHQWLNDLVGLIGHSILFVPYFSWKHSHRRHHANTGSAAYDEAFIPKVRDQVMEENAYVDIFRFTAATRFVSLCFVLVFGFPLYLLGHWGGRKYPGWANHFNPWSPVFRRKERLEVLISDVGLAVVTYGLYLVAQSFGFATVVKTYIIPYFVVHVWLVLITFLHHTHPECPHFHDTEWNWLKGSLSTVDRSFGFLDIIFHRITDTHVLHHLFSQIPHYHAKEATEAIKPVIGKYYKSDDRNLVRAVWEDFRDTKYAAPDKKGEGVLWFRR